MSRNDYTLLELIACAEREVRVRQRVYPGRVYTGRMSQREADRQLAMMQAIAAKLRELAQAELLV
jgi:hypothetical protein